MGMVKFDFSQVNVHWFPSHMARGMQAMERRLKRLDVVVEVRDARIPFSSANPLMEQLGQEVKRIVVFNKSDLADPVANKNLMNFLKKNSLIEFMLIESNNRRQITHLLERIKGHCLPEAQEKPEKTFRMIVAGMPNVGKSTIINRLRAVGTGIGGKAVRTGGIPGVTRALSEYVKISSFPRLYMLDSPGVLMPKIVDPEVGLKIALTGAMLDRVVGDYLIGEYLFFMLMERQKSHVLRKRFELDRIPEQFPQFLPLLAEKLNMTQHGSFNMANCVGMFLRIYRNGELGRFTLEDIPR